MYIVNSYIKIHGVLLQIYNTPYLVHYFSKFLRKFVQLCMNYEHNMHISACIFTMKNILDLYILYTN